MANRKVKVKPVTDPENPEWTDDDFAKARPAAEMVPNIVARYRGQRGQQKAPTKVQVSLRLDADLVDKIKEDGKGWQTRLNDFLREVMLSADALASAAHHGSKVVAGSARSKKASAGSALSARKRPVKRSRTGKRLLEL